jgi:hypothetical protein
MLKITMAIAAAVLISACSTTKPALPKPEIKSIAIIPATDPTEYTLENLSATQFVIPIASLFNHLDSKSKAKIFNDRLNAKPMALANTFTNDVADALRAHGYRVDILQNVTRPADDPDNLDYSKISSSSDAMLHLRFTEVGLFSARSSQDYIPRVDGYGVVFIVGREDYLYDDEVYWGVDAAKGKKNTILPDKQFAYPSFESVLSNLNNIRSAFDVGTHQMAVLMAQQIHETLK